MTKTFYRCSKCREKTESGIKWCPVCGGKVVQQTVYIPDDVIKASSGRIFDNYVLPELAEKLGISHLELLELNKTNPDKLDKLIEEIK
jgi:hypothetical protein